MYKKWEILWASVKFEDSNKVKDRPILVLADVKQEVIAYKITSQNKEATIPTYRIIDWQKTGLEKESWVIILKPIKVHKSKILSKCGNLQILDIYNLEKELQ